MSPTFTPAGPVPQWSLAVQAIGITFIFLTLVLGLTVAVVRLFAPQAIPENWLNRAYAFAMLSPLVSFACLVTLFVRNQFQFEYVWKHGKLDHDLGFKIAGVWSGQEGSILLWTISSSLMALLAIRGTGEYRRFYQGVTALFVAGLAGILAYESPFLMHDFGAATPYIPADGVGMSPQLLNYWVKIHPPVIFAGFGSLLVLFGYAMAALLQKNLTAWINQVRPWGIVSLTLMGLGLCMGGFWAYETLGWGGFWMWDPVENTSFVPWVTAAALVHGIFVQKAQGKWHLVNPWFAATPLVLFCYGTFLTRSGFLGDTSVHSFANMDKNALWILIAVGSLTLLGFTGVWFWKRSEILPTLPKAKKVSGVLHREAFLTTGIWLLLFTGIITGIGMSVPLIQSLAGQQPKMVEETVYNQILALPWVAIAVLMAVGPFTSWRKMTSKELFQRLAMSLAISFSVLGLLVFWMRFANTELVIGNFALYIPGQQLDPAHTVMLFGRYPVAGFPWIMIMTWVGVFGLVANVWVAAEKIKRSPSTFGAMLTHFGVLATMIGLIVSRGMQQRVDGLIHDTRTMSAFGYTVSLIGPTSQFMDRNNRIRFQVSKPGGDQFVASPGLYYIVNQNESEPSPMVWPFIRTNLLYDLYVVAHAFTFQGSEPTPLKVGESARFNDVILQYNGLRTQGSPGTIGATFIADVTVMTSDGSQRTVSPQIKLVGRGELENEAVPLSPHLSLKLDRINAADKEASFVIDYRTPAYPVEIYYKPLVILVWWGVGLMTVGGFISAWTRRMRHGQAKLVTDGATATGDGPEEAQPTLGTSAESLESSIMPESVTPEDAPATTPEVETPSR